MDGGEFAGGVERGHGGEGDAITAGVDEEDAVAGEGDDVVRHGGVHDEEFGAFAGWHGDGGEIPGRVGFEDGKSRDAFTGGEGGEEPLFMLFAGAGGDGGGGGEVGQQRAGDERAAGLFHGGGDFDEVEPHAAVGFRDGHAAPALFGGFAPEFAIMRCFGLAEAPHFGDGVFGGEELAGGVTSEYLGVSKAELHVSNSWGGRGRSGQG